MSEYLARITEQRNQTWVRAKEIMDGAATEGRELSPEERQNLDDLDKALDQLKADGERFERMSKLAEGIEAFVGEPVRTSRARTAKTDGEKLQAMLRGELRNFTSSYSPGYTERALQSEGGSAVPTTFADFVVNYARTLNPTYDLATKIQTNSGETFTIPRLTADPAYGGTVTAEGGGITLLDPTLSNVSLGAYGYKGITKWSIELSQDEVINIQSLIARSTARELGLDIGTHFTTGDGNGKPNGFITAATNGGTAAGTAVTGETFFALHDLYGLFYGLPAPTRSVSSWQVSNGALLKIRRFTDDNGQYLWQPSQIVGQPDSLLGRPIYENPAMAAVASASKSVAVGDFSAYYVREVVPMLVDVSTEAYFGTGEIGIRTIWRIDGDLPDVTAIRYLVSSDT